MLRLRIASLTNLFGALVIGCVALIGTVGGMALSELKVGGPLYSRIVLGKDLVADTIGLRGDMMLTMNGLGLSDALRVKERFHQVDADTLTDTITLEDPKALRKPWTVVKTFRRSPQTQIMEYVCEENNRNPIRPDGSTGVVLSGQRGQ